MSKQNLNIMRTLRLQLKCGYLKEEPPAYSFMKRYPPLTRDTAPPVRKIQAKNIPYLGLYDKVIQKNPQYADERVYPAYWQNEPQALTLAKKQYELIQSGASEQDAYEEAVKYVDELESKSYEALQELLANVQGGGARLPFLADPELASAISAWRKLLSETSYLEMEEADQGEIDFLIQTKILKWNEVERERRMRDPIFVMQFERLRSTIFPEIAEVLSKQQTEGHKDFKEKLLAVYNVTPSRLCTTSAFYYEDYARLFAKLKAQPMLARWSERDREALSRWIIDTLAYREIIEKGSTAKVQKYLDDLRAQFFPMVRYPGRAASFSLPSLKEIKAILYKNDIGYKRDPEAVATPEKGESEASVAESADGKLLIKRFYKIPMLLFPEETFTTTLLADQEKLKAVVDDDASLLKEIMTAGLDEASLPELQKQLKDYLSGANSSLGVPSDYGVRVSRLKGGGGSSVDMSVLDALLKDEDEYDKDASIDDILGEDPAALAAAAELDAAAADDLEVGEAAVARVAEDEITIEHTEEWSRLIKEYVKPPVTKLEEERDRIFSKLEYSSWKDARTESDIFTFRRQRVENQLVTRARLSVEYEKKEAARRTREWKQRGVWLDRLPPPELQLVDDRLH